MKEAGTSVDVAGFFALAAPGWRFRIRSSMPAVSATSDLEDLRNRYRELLDVYGVQLRGLRREEAQRTLAIAGDVWAELCRRAVDDIEHGAEFMHAVLAFSQAVAQGDAVEAKRIFLMMGENHRRATAKELRIWE